MPSPEDRKLLRKLIAEHYAEAAANNFSLDEVKVSLRSDAVLPTLFAAMADDWLDKAVAAYDAEQTRSESQGSLFGDDDRVIALPNGRRQRRGTLQLRQVQQHLAYVDENAAKVAAAADREHLAYGLLEPWLLDGLTWSEARDAYAQANP